MSNIHLHMFVSSSNDMKDDVQYNSSKHISNLKKRILIRQPLMNLYLLSFITFFTRHIHGYVPLLSKHEFSKSIVSTDISSTFQINSHKSMHPSLWKFKNKSTWNHLSSSSTFEDTSNTDEIANELLTVINKKSNEKKEDSNNEETIRTLLTKLETNTKKMDVNESPDRFQSLIGLYTVRQVITKNKNENPVGGKWTRKNSLAQLFFKSRRTFQHILESSSHKDSIVAEAINVISLDALLGLIRITVMLRGDAVPLSIEERTKLQLSNYAVRAYFDPPRIVFGKSGRIFNIHLGPKSSVILDTTYIDDRVRIGKGGMSGSRFVFQRCNVTDVEEMKEANEFRSLLDRPPLKKSKMKAILISILTFGVYNVKVGRNTLGTAMLFLSCLGGIVMKFSTGGIEEDQLDAANQNMADQLKTTN